MGGRVHLGIGLLDASVGPDQVADALRGGRLGVVAGPVGQADLPRGVAQEREVVVELPGEGGVLLRGVEADAQDLRALLRVLLVVVAEPATLLGSTRGVGLWVEPEDHRPAAVVRQLLELPRVILHREIGGHLTLFEHPDLPSPQGLEPGGHPPHRGLQRAGGPATVVFAHDVHSRIAEKAAATGPPWP